VTCSEWNAEHIVDCCKEEVCTNSSDSHFRQHDGSNNVKQVILSTKIHTIKTDTKAQQKQLLS